MSNKKVKFTYTIDLDEIDINVLQFRSYNQNKKRLWSLNNSGSQCYYDFEVMAARRDVIEEDRDGTSTDEEIYKNYKCHICNINVPIAFFTEHNSSAIHKTYAGIANNAMERIKLHMNLVIEVAPTKTSSVHFCEICVLLIKKIDRVEHEKSLVHEISMTHSKLLQDLTNIYINNDFKVESSHLASKTNDNTKLPNNDLKASKEIDPKYEKEWWGTEPDSQALESKKITNRLEKNSSLLLESNEICEDNKKQIDHKLHANHVIFDGIGKNVDKDSLIVSENTCVQINNKNDAKKNVATNSKIRNEVHWINSKDYINHINTINNEKLITAAEGLIRIKTVSGDILKVSLKQFCGYIKIGNEWGCNLCQLYIVNDGDDRHEYTDKHVKCIVLPLQDKNCLRMLNDYYQHCVVCNLLLQHSYVPKHITLESHITMIKEALINNEELLKESTSLKHEDVLVPKYKYCQPCGRDIFILSILSHRISIAHLRNVKIFENSKGSTEVSAANAQNIYHCATCNEDIHTHNMASLQTGCTHLKKIMKNQDVAENNVLTTSEDECDKCIEMKEEEKRLKSNGTSTPNAPNIDQCATYSGDVRTGNMSSQQTSETHLLKTSSSEDLFGVISNAMKAYPGPDGTGRYPRPRPRQRWRRTRHSAA